MASIFLSLGSNLGDSKQILLQAIEELKKIGTVMAVSSFYTTQPVGFIDQLWFLNGVVKMETKLPPLELLQETQKIENMFGRERKVHWGPRTLDIDILFYDDLIFDTPELILPHPRLHERKFVLEPLTEIEKNFHHPLLRFSAVQLLEKSSDQSQVKKMT